SFKVTEGNAGPNQGVQRQAMSAV
ncbi:MAG: hypothetical protein AVDCRST_MAG90-2099, partial [uncultured Microvirga sp.]